jgi:predicted Ser/Thr protein kinase
MTAADLTRGELPEDLADCAAAQLMAVAGPERAAVLAEWLASHPGHANALHRLHEELAGAERVLAGAYRERPAEIPSHVGGHRVLRRLGEGAFGTVFLCAQEQPVVREVAVKVLRPGAGDEHTLRRFAAERQLLASLNHPAITQLYDAGVLPDGRPFFVMEYVDGRSIRRYCDERGLPCRDRLRLFVELCRGVAYAHHRGIVHRDLKPANVLVVDTDQGPMPKIIDFGIAKALAATDGGEGPRTDAGRVLGTPGYMSPEQAQGRVNEVDPRADVFALGVMLYELMTGELPWEKGAAATDAEPLRPSARVTTTTGTTVSAPPQRRQLAAALRGDVDWITLKALAREPGERYAGAAALADDLERHLRGDPVSAGPPSAAYRLRKALRRHRTACGWAAACLCVLGAGTAVVLQFRSQATDSESARLAAVSDAVNSLYLRALDAFRADGPDLVVQQLLLDALALHERELQARPDRVDLRRQRTRILLELAATGYQIGEFRRSREMAGEARLESEALMRIDADPGHEARRAAALRELCRSSFRLQDFAGARTHGAEAVAAYEELHRREPRAYAKLLAKALVEHASALSSTGDADGQLAAQRRALEILQAFVAAQPDDEEVQRDLVRFHCGLANMMLARRDLVAAEAALREAQAFVQRFPLVTDEERALVAWRLTKLCAAMQQPAEAIAHAERALALYQELLRLHPGRHQERSTIVRLRRLLFEQRVELGEDESAVAQATALVAMQDGLTPQIAWEVADALVAMAQRALDSMPFATFAPAEGWLEVALQRLAAAEPIGPVQANRVEAETLRGFALDELGRPLPADHWDAVAADAESLNSAYAGFARLLASRRRLADGDLDGARAALAAARAALDGIGAEVDLARQALAIELAARDPVAAARAAQQTFASHDSIVPRIAAALGFAQASALASGDGGDPVVANDCRTRAIELCRQIVAEAPESERRALARAQAGVCLAELGDGDAEALRAEHLPALDAMRGRVAASRWSEPLWLEAHMAVIRAELRAQRPGAALAAVESLAPQLRSAAGLVDLAAVCIACGRSAPEARAAPATARADAAALVALARAVDLGLRGRQRLLDRPELAPLHHDATFRALVARIPD